MSTEDDEQVMRERDWAQDCLQNTHIALGGDGEWTGKLPPEAPPDSGDLHYDVPALAAERMAEIARLRAALTEIRDSSHGRIGDAYAHRAIAEKALRPETTG